MKKIYKILPIAFLPLVVLLLAYSSGSPGGKTGSPGDDGATCTQCHSGTAQTIDNWISTNIPAGGYEAGQTYTITAAGFHLGVSKFGFELTAENTSGAKVGTFAIINANETQLTNNNKAVTHKTGGTIPIGNSKIWTMSWTAPNPAVGNVTFYGAFNAANGNGGTSGDVIYKTQHTVPAQPAGVDVTFRVDMAEQTVSPLGVHVAGNFQNWIPSATEMFLVSDAIYAVTVNLVPGQEIEFKYVNGDSWGMDEQVPAGCAQNGNRYFTVPNSNYTLEAVCFGSCAVCNPPLVDITFQVDMSNETVSPNGVHVAGSFQGWDPAGTEMLPVGNNVYAVTTQLEAGNYYEYKFINGNAWGGDETVPPQCATGWNRFITVPSVPTTLDAVCFGSCYPCGPPPIDIEVTFQVDMSEQVISPDGVHIAGGFQGWNPGLTPMDPAGDNIYTYSTILPSGTYQEYKFINGIDWSVSENVPGECGFNNNRYLNVPMNDTLIPVVCYGACGPCGPPPVDVNVTFRVDMTDEFISADGVHVAGTFQGWNASSTPMTDVGDNIYEVTVVLSSGDYHEFKYINGISFDFVELVPEACGVPDGQGGFNRYFTVPSNDTTFSLVCFGSCEPCLPPQPTHTVTFRVDMTNETVSANGVHLAGNFQGWNPGSLPMTTSGNNIYECQVILEEMDYIEYKFINGDTFEGAELVPGACAQNGNRFLEVPAQDTTLTAVCFGGCEPCVPPTPVSITFLVDMTYEVISPEGVHLAGSFQGWDPTTTALANISENIYGITIPLIAGDYHEFKFINGTSFDVAETVPQECGVPDGFGGFSRYITVPANDTTLMAVCFSSCDTCGPPPVDVEVTFRVDMANEIVSVLGVHLAGTFQGWDPNATLMTNTSEAIYEYTFTLQSGSVHEYKFINGNAWGMQETVPAACAQNNNRFIEVPAMDTVLTALCYGSCEICPPISVNENNVDNPWRKTFYPNPATKTIWFDSRFAGSINVSVKSIDGTVLINAQIYQKSLDISSLTKGLYFVIVEDLSGIYFSKLVIQ